MREQVTATSDAMEKYKRRYYVLASAARNFAAGIEYTIVAPSIWFYLHQFHGSNFFLGLLQSSFQFAGVIGLTAFGRIYDKTRRTKYLVAASNFAEIIGNLIYCLGFSKYVLLLGRLVSGLGEGFASIVYAEVGSVFAPSERLKAIGLMEGGRAVGLVAGPLCNFAFMKVDTHIGSWHITYGSAAGLVMCAIWILVQCVTMTFIYDMYREKHQSTTTTNTTSTDERDESKAALLDEMQSSDTDEAENKPQQINYLTLRESMCDVLTLEPLVVISADVLFCASSSVFNALIPLALTEDLGWGTVNVALFYLVMTSLVVATLVGVQFAPQLDEISTLIACAVVNCGVHISMFCYHYLRPHRVPMALTLTTTMTVFSILSAFSMIVGRTMLTKLVLPDNQGFTQGFYSTAVSVAMTIGPLIGSTLLYHLNVWAPIAFTLFAAVVVALFILRKRIRNRASEVNDMRTLEVTT